MKTCQRYTIFIVFWLTVSASVFSQQLISTAGNTVVKSNLSMSWSLGEVAVQTLSFDNLILSQGFHQPMKLPTGFSLQPELLQLRVYPNPTSDFIHLEVEDCRNLAYTLVNTLGAVLQDNVLVDNRTIISAEDLPSGLYYLNIYKEKQLISCTKVSVVR